MQFPKCLFYMGNYIDQVGNGTCMWKKFQGEIVHQRKLTKKHIFVWAHFGRFQNIIHLLQNPKLQRNAMGFNSHNLFHKTQKHWMLHITLCGTNITLNVPTHSIHMEAIGVYGTFFKLIELYT